MKKIVSLLAATAIAFTLLTVPALAHGHGGSRVSGATRVGYALCSVENCNMAYTHSHANTWYAGHSLADGHEYHQVCGVLGCSITTTHEHDGVTCFPHSANDGHGYHHSAYGGGHH